MRDSSRQARNRTYAAILRKGWAQHGTTLLWLAVGIMIVAALHMMGREFWRLLWDQGRFGAIDLRMRYDEVHRWFAGMPVYGELQPAVYPPASYAILWPLLGWLAVTPARWLWALTSFAALGWLAYLMVREGGANMPLERVFVTLMLLSMYATGDTIGNGQLIVHLLPVLLAGLLLLCKRPGGWHQDLLGAALVLVALVQPTVSVPFFWVVLFVPGRWRPAVLVASGYVALTLFAASFQQTPLPTLLQGWLVQGSAMAVAGGYANLHISLAALGLEEWILPASLVTLLVLGFWIYRRHHVDLWLLLGITALVARFWMYHRPYDDVLILLPEVALFRIAKRGPCDDGSDVVAGLLLGITLLAMLIPTWLLFFMPMWALPFTGGQVVTWIIMLVFLLDRARRDESARGT